MKRLLLHCGILVFMLMTLTILSAQNERNFTLQELSKYNGHNGAKAYVAINGVVYDVTNVPSWRLGKHFCPGALAGKDITLLWNQVPRSHQNPDFLKNFPAVGHLVSQKPAPQTPNKIRSTNPPSQEKKPSQLQPYMWAGLALIVLCAVWIIARFRRK